VASPRPPARDAAGILDRAARSSRSPPPGGAPGGNLDSQTGGEILELILELRERRGMTVIVATHDALIASACDRVVRLHDGKVLDDVPVTHEDDESEILDRIGRLDA